MKDRKYEVRIRKWLAELESGLAENAQDFVRESKIYYRDADMEESQINNLIQLSEETRSFESVKSFIRYQMSRSKKEKQWNYAENTDQRFGEFLISRLDEFFDKYKIEMKDFVEETGYDKSKIFWNLIQLYIGYIRWYFVYEKGLQT